MRRLMSLRLLATILLAASGVTRASADEINPTEGLAMQLFRTAGMVIGAEPLTMYDMESARILIEEAVALDPDNLEVQHFAKNLALLMEDQESYKRALDRISQLDPADTVTRMQRINLALDQHQVAEERIEAYRRLLNSDNAGSLGPAVASRLWYDLAQLYSRRGDREYADALAKALEIDPSNRLAAAEAAGFFRTNVDDPAGEAELLINLLLADPADLVTQVALGVLLLENAAYDAASRIYQLALENYMVSRIWPPDDLVADHAIAQWASGQADQALRTIHVRQQLSDQLARDRAVREDADENPLQHRDLRGTLGPTLATVRAAISAAQGSADAPAHLRGAIESHRSRIAGENRQEPLSDEEIAQLRLELAWVLLWLDGEVEEAQRQIEMATELVPLTDAARDRFEGWIALRQDNVDRAVELLQPLAESDAAAGLGLARAYQHRGQKRDAARLLLSIARDQPGSVIGVRAVNELAELLGRRAPLTDQARKLQELIGSIPSYIFQLPETPSLAVEVTVESSKPVFDPFDPFIINVEVANNGLFPLAIDRHGPIRPYIVLYFETTFRRSGLRYELEPVVLAIDRRLRIDPRERLNVPVDLRQYPIGEVLNSNVLHGTFVRVRAMLNAAPNRLVLEPSRLGDEDRMRTARVEGVRLSTQWLTQAIEAVTEAGADADLRTVALISYVIQSPLTEDAPPEQVRLLEQARDVLSETFSKLQPIEQAWLLGVMPEALLPEQMQSVAQRSEDRLVQLSYLLNQVTGPGDPMLDAAMRSDDQHLRRLAAGYLQRFQQSQP